MKYEKPCLSPPLTTTDFKTKFEGSRKMTTVFTVTTHLLTMFRRIGEDINNQSYGEAVDKINALLSSHNLNQTQRDNLLYYKAIALDYQKHYMEALQILSELKDRSPNSIQILHSLRVVLSNLADKTRELISKNPESEEILTLDLLMSEHDFCPFLIRLHAAKMRALQGEKENACALLKAYLTLSPYDEDYLKGALEIALIVKDDEWKVELINRLEHIIHYYPFRMEIAEILDEFWDLGGVK